MWPTILFSTPVCVCVSARFAVLPASRVTQSITCGLQGQWAEEMKGYQAGETEREKRLAEGKDRGTARETFKLEAM